MISEPRGHHFRAFGAQRAKANTTAAEIFGSGRVYDKCVVNDDFFNFLMHSLFINFRFNIFPRVLVVLAPQRCSRLFKCVAKVKENYPSKFNEKLKILSHRADDIFEDFGPSPGFPGRISEHFGAQRAKANT